MPEKEASIIKVIREMMQNGEPNEKIIKTLVEMGVMPAQAKRLVMIGQADTLTVLSQDIGKIAKSQIENELPALNREIETRLVEARKELRKSVKDELDEDLEGFRKHVDEDIKLVNQVSSNYESKIQKIDAKVEDVRSELKDMQMRRLGTKNEWISLMLLLGGMIFNAFALYVIYSTFASGAITLDALVLILVITLTGITMLFGSSII